MVCTANDLSAWKDFPKGLRVLLFDEDNVSASEMKSKLEDMDYVVFLFSNENDALSAISSNLESFHVAIVEVNSSNSDICFKFLEAAKNLPTIMTSSIHCLSTMMKCIALGAVEFLQKPLSDDKLRNIWQHVVHKAFNTGAPASSESLKPVKESVASILQLKSETELAEKTEELADGHISHSEENEELPPSKYPAPSTLELDHGKRPVDVTVCQDKDSGKQELGFEPTVVTCTMVELTNVNHSQSIKRTVVKEEDDSTEGVKNDSAISVDPKTKESVDNSKGIIDNQSKSSGLKTSNGVKANRKKTKLDWKPELHKKFLQAVEQLGVDQAIPSRILEVMNVEGLTRHNIASHLQKYRMHHRHILPKEDDQRWTQQRNQMQRSYYPHGPVIAYPAYQSNNRLQPTPVYSLWGGNSNQHRGVPAWAPPSYLSWTPAESWHWKSYPRIHIEASGCPTMPPLHGCYPSFPQTVQYLPTLHSGGMVESGCSFNMQHSSFCQYPTDEVIDKVVKEAISKPWLPLPLGLRPPSTDSVLSELYKQGICSVPPHKNGPTES